MKKLKLVIIIGGFALLTLSASCSGLTTNNYNSTQNGTQTNNGGSKVDANNLKIEDYFHKWVSVVDSQYYVDIKTTNNFQGRLAIYDVRLNDADAQARKQANKETADEYATFNSDKSLTLMYDSGSYATASGIPHDVSYTFKIDVQGSTNAPEIYLRPWDVSTSSFIRTDKYIISNN